MSERVKSALFEGAAGSGAGECPKGGAHEWGIDGAHSNEYCKKCFVSRDTAGSGGRRGMIVGFDWDGTLVESWTSTPLPGVRERLAALPPGTCTFIATNQAGPVWRQMTNLAKYPTAADVAGRISEGLRALDWAPDYLLICTYASPDWVEAAAVQRYLILKCLDVPPTTTIFVWDEPGWRKPEPDMLFEAMQYFGEFDCLYIGDMETDEQAAKAAGCRYLDAAVWRDRGI